MVLGHAIILTCFYHTNPCGPWGLLALAFYLRYEEHEKPWWDCWYFKKEAFNQFLLLMHYIIGLLSYSNLFCLSSCEDILINCYICIALELLANFLFHFSFLFWYFLRAFVKIFASVFPDGVPARRESCSSVGRGIIAGTPLAWGFGVVLLGLPWPVQAGLDLCAGAPSGSGLRCLSTWMASD